MQHFLILSDVHGNAARLLRVLELHKDATAVLFLGDGLDEVRGISSRIPLYAVRGNCDYGASEEDELLVKIGRHRALILHGHTAGAKSGEDGLIARARARGADIVLYGHTHLRSERYLPPEEGGPLWIFNPGSLGFPYESPPSFGTLTVDGRGNLLFGYGEVSEDIL